MRNPLMWDREKQNLVYVTAVEGEDGLRLVMALDRSVKVSDAKGDWPRRLRTNQLINAHMVDVGSLRDRRTYELVDGSI